MSIEIINVTENWSDALHHYELRINKDCLAKFTHVPDEGLSVCLHNAIQAYEQSLTSPTSTDPINGCPVQMRTHIRSAHRRRMHNGERMLQVQLCKLSAGLKHRRQTNIEW